MGAEYSVFHPVTASVCRQCHTLNFPGCRNHKQLLTLPYGVDGIATRCGGPRCEVNTTKSRFPCVSCASRDNDFYRVTLSEKETERVLSAFKNRCGNKDPHHVRVPTCLLLCTQCSSALFPIIDNNLCVASSTGQLVDGAGQSVDLAMWQSHFVHCNNQCAGTKGRDFLARIDVNLNLPELEYAKKRIKGSTLGRWRDFRYTTGHIRMPTAHRASTHISVAPAPVPSVATPPTSSTAVGLNNSMQNLSLTNVVDLNQTHPIAIGVCKQCMFVNFPGCAKHRTLLSKPYDVVDGRGKTTYAGCSAEGCETNTRFVAYSCAGCRGKEFSWYHVVLTDHEGSYVVKAWQGRGLGFSANSKLSHSIIICNLCLSTSFPGESRKLCESKHGKLISAVTGAPMDVGRWKDSHPHITGCPGVGRVDVLMRVDMVLHGPEVQYLSQNLQGAARGHWNPAFVQAGRYVDPNAVAAAVAAAHPPPTSSSSSAFAYPMPPATTNTPAYPPAYPGFPPGGYTPYPTMPAPYPTAGGPAYVDPITGAMVAPAPISSGAPYPTSPVAASAGAYPGPYPPSPFQHGMGSSSGIVPAAAFGGPYPPPDGSAYPFAAYAAAAGAPQQQQQQQQFLATSSSSSSTTTATTPMPAYPFPGAAAAAPAPVSATPVAPAAASGGVTSPSAPPVDHAGSAEKEDESLCVICLCEKRDVIFYKCGHLAACHDCAQQLKRQQKGCPICRQPILDIVKVYNA